MDGSGGAIVAPPRLVWRPSTVAIKVKPGSKQCAAAAKVKIMLLVVDTASPVVGMCIILKF